MARSVGVQVFTEFPGLEQIERTAKKRAVTLKAVKAGAKLVQSGAKSRVPKRKKSGALKQSLGIKSQKGTRGKTLAFAVVGARSKVVKLYKGKTIKPSKYSHLVERGTRTAKPKPFLKPSLDTQKQAISAAMLRVLSAEILKVTSAKKG